MYPEQPDFETPYVFSIDGMAGDTPMTDKTREKIAKEICPLVSMQGECERCQKGEGCPDEWPDIASKVDAILAIAEIQEGQELREKAKSGKLVELDDAYSQDPKEIRVANMQTSELMWVKQDSFRRVKVKGE